MKSLSINLLLFLAPILCFADELPGSISFEKGPVNRVVVDQNGKHLFINRGIRSLKGDTILMTHARRDIVRSVIDSGAAHWIAPEASQALLESASEGWQAWWEDRFNYYQQQVRRVPLKSESAERYLKDGEEIQWEGLSFRFMETPGYTRDGGSYLVEIDGVKIAFTGDWILKGGQVPDLYSFQNEIRDAKIGGYHGYMGRLSVWLKTVEKMIDEVPDLIVPARGDVITDPVADLTKAAETARAIYRNYLSTNALHWYFGEERMGKCAELVLGPDHGVKGMPFAEHIDLPDWCQHIGTTKLLVAEDGSGFALDVGGAKAHEALRKALEEGLIKSLDGIFVTHTHNDHTAAVGAAALEFGCPVYAIAEVADTLKNPGNWFLPGVSPNAVHEVIAKKNGETMTWKGFEFTFHFYPGQMYNHGALLVGKPDHDPVFFIGDSFSPSGIDDYCLMNRNLMRDDTGYALCFQKLEEKGPACWIVNQHIPHLFRFNDKELGFLKSQYSKRRQLIDGFTPWEDPNFAIDEQWASFYPYGQEVAPEVKTETEVRLWNHADEDREFVVTLRGSMISEPITKSIVINGRGQGKVSFEVSVADDAEADSVHVLTADVEITGQVKLREWTESLLRVRK